MAKVLVLMCGIPGSGKTTWAKSILDDAGEVPVHYVSRDEIRFSLLEKDDEYFAKEYEVFTKWIETIQSYIDNKDEECYIIADATHLNENSRNKLLDHLMLPDDIKILPVVVNPDLEKCLERNELREGRSRVPRSAMRRMYNCFKVPTENEKYKYESILFVKE